MLSERHETVFTVLADGQIQVRTDRIIEDDGIEIARTHHRSVVAPGDDLSSHVQRVQDVAGVVWTAEVVKDYQDKKVALSSSIPARVE